MLSRRRFIKAAIGGSGAGGVAAEILAKSGLRVIVVEEGPLRSSRSLFPTSIGVNPQESVYAIAARNISLLAESMTGQAAAALA